VSEEIDREAPTPRISTTFEIWRALSLELSELLGGVEMRLSRDPLLHDREEARRAKNLREVANDFVRVFTRWQTLPASIPIDAKLMQRKEFEIFDKLARAFIEEHVKKAA
jgi:hypothetical protein